MHLHPFRSFAAGNAKDGARAGLPADAPQRRVPGCLGTTKTPLILSDFQIKGVFAYCIAFLKEMKNHLPIILILL
jgi:hypothetical protein